MTPSKPRNETGDASRQVRGIDLQTAYAVLIRAYLRRLGADRKDNGTASGKAPRLP